MAAGRRLGAVVAAMLVVGAAASVARAQSYGIYGVDSYFKVEAQPDQRRGKPIVSGYVTNEAGLAARNVRLRVEALARRGEVTCEHRALDALHHRAHAQHVGGIARLGHGLDLGARGHHGDAVERSGRSRIGLEAHDADPP